MLARQKSEMLPLVNELCGELGSSKLSTAARSNCPSGRVQARLLCLLRARLAAPGSSALPGRGRPTSVQPPPRGLERAASKAANFTAFGHAGTVIVMHRFPAWMPSLFRVSDLIVRISEAA